MKEANKTIWMTPKSIRDKELRQILQDTIPDEHVVECENCKKLQKTLDGISFSL